jgi:type VI secretion system secreted protein Hcp
MTQSAYLFVDGSQSGKIQGSVADPKKEGSIRVVGVDHAIVTPVSESMRAGSTSHQPFIVSTEVDAATPQLYSALAANEQLREVRLELWDTSEETGEDVNRFQVSLTDAFVSGMRLVLPDLQDQGAAPKTGHVEVTFSYRAIEWTSPENGFSASDTAAGVR